MMHEQSETTKGLVSIGIPTYNRPEALRKALTVAITQTYPHLEIIVSDNASTDIRVKQVIEEFVKKDARIKFYQQEENKGLLYNTEFVLKQARGEYFAWLSDDDWRSPEFIETLVKALEQQPEINFAFCDYHEVYENGTAALDYPPTHIPIFKPFTNPSRFKRLINYFWQDGRLGKSNIFYAVFRKVVLERLDLKKISDNYTLLNMDCLIDFSVLQQGPIIIVPQAMCTLTCCNKKYYSDDKAVPLKQTSAVSKVTNLWARHRQDRTPYIRCTDSLVEKGVIYGLSVLKFVREFAQLIIKKFKTESNQNATVALVSEASVSKANNTPLLELPNVTLVAMTSVQVEETLQALIYSCKNVKFGKVKLIAHYTPFRLQYHPYIEFIRMDRSRTNNIDKWCYEVIYGLNEFIDTEFALLVHADGFVVNPDMWRAEFLQYDYIGAPWPLPTDDFSYRDIHGNIVRVGNSVSLRSKRLLELPIKLNLPWEPFHGNYHEDGFICAKNKHIYEAHGMKIAPLEVAKYFSHERMIPEVQGIKPFVFHKWEGSNSVYPKFYHMGTL